MNSKPLFLHDDLNEYFYNRKNDIKKLKYQINSLNYSLPQQILLTGYRGVGKTYLLKKIMDETESNIIYAYIGYRTTLCTGERRSNNRNCTY